jgi:hypothetical protein
MRRALALLVVPLCAAGLLAASGCGVAANDTAATVDGTTVSTTTVDELAGDPQFVQALRQGSVPSVNPAVLPGDDARAALTFEIQRVALLQEVERWGLKIPDQARSQVRAGIAQQFPGMSKANIAHVVDYVAAQTVLEQRLAKLDPTDKGDLRKLYDGAPALWDQTCLTAVSLPATGSAERSAQRALDGGTGLTGLAGKVKDAQLVADPAQGCVTATQLPSALRDDLKVATVREVRGPIVVTGARGATAVFYRIESTRKLTFDTAGKDLATLAQGLQQRAQQQSAAQAWISLVLQKGVTINPRYGSALVPSTSGQLEVTPPQAPVTSLPLTTLPRAGSQQQPPAQQQDPAAQQQAPAAQQQAPAAQQQAPAAQQQAPAAATSP